ncbi:16S rRNA (uracil(1498)-N(3))-methyltransferase [Herbaspirillum sp. RTI4]|uniref:16S rRNA (uracil(1498)-N(3))-methyltransferase n=1 Tax=Herbaspirillum sp. RTI4 TaxID=3048640 RepID=UPI002AB50C9B|nr:16S rRNA (uracil(1498)-N(3))-methyltransferase [Herbaspirillum sp. RTI4]MDY7578168.1 16S rRNA (uracil(1498)-N(3))-methyltransferase [Herbaspirillum sp. RTI4]MEA9980757.1 16S rRNA (uracil(1498)-N(3))-methyltransferase [Herbaspirillum sp. RTI4]
MPRFYCPCPLTVGATLSLPEHLAHHVQVLRLQPGATLTLFNGEGGEYTASLTSVERKRAEVDIKLFSPHEVELPYALTLAQALPEGSKMEWIIEKAVELGAAVIQPLAAQRCVVRLAGDRAEKKRAHWQAVVSAAAEQCGRNRLAAVAAPLDFNRWITQQDLHKRILLSPRGTQSLSDWARHHPPQALSLLIGPEGGFTDTEENLACEQGALMLTMGARVLRTETAGLSALAALNAIWGEM